MYRFEKLRVYNNAIMFVEIIYKLTSTFPQSEQYVLVSQLKRSSLSIVLNIAEGSSGTGDLQFKRYLKIALGSLYESVAGLKVAEKLFDINIVEALENCNTIGKELQALIKSLDLKN